MTGSSFAAIGVGVLLNAAAQLLLKAGVTSLGPIEISLPSLLPVALGVLSQWQIIVGLGCYVVSVGIWIFALSHVDVSIAYPMLSLGYVVTALCAWWLFGESITIARCAGIGLILGGVMVMARS